MRTTRMAAVLLTTSVTDPESILVVVEDTAHELSLLNATLAPR
jgi:hypothetical protein